MNKLFFSIIILLIVLSACKQPTQGTTKSPDPPRMVQKTEGADTMLYEPGIDALPGLNNEIELVWYKAAFEQDIDFYRIYRSAETSGNANYLSIGVSTSNSGEDTTFIDKNNLGVDTTYYYFVTAVNRDGKESLPSDTVWYKLLPKARPTSPSGVETNQQSIAFTFNIPPNAIPNGYIIRIEHQIGQNLIELTYIDVVEPLVNFGETQISYILDKDVTTIFQNNTEYRWRIDLLSGDKKHSGSESEWLYFSTNWGT